MLVRAVEQLTVSFVPERPRVGRDDVVDEVTGLAVRYLDAAVGPV